VRSSSSAQARGSPNVQRVEARLFTQVGAADVPSEHAVSELVAQPLYETWQGRENCVARDAIDEIPSHRIARNALELRAQVRRLLGIRIVAGCARGLGKLSAVTVAFGDAQLFPQDRVRTPAIGRAWRMRPAQEHNFLVLRSVV
jgi:hypothetical protein